MAKKRKAPTGTTRVVGVDILNHVDYLVGDYDSQKEAFKIADKHNTERSDSTDDVYYVYNDEGLYIRGNEAVEQKVSY